MSKRWIGAVFFVLCCIVVSVVVITENLLFVSIMPEYKCLAKLSVPFVSKYIRVRNDAPNMQNFPFPNFNILDFRIRDKIIDRFAHVESLVWSKNSRTGREGQKWKSKPSGQFTWQNLCMGLIRDLMCWRFPQVNNSRHSLKFYPMGSVLIDAGTDHNRYVSTQLLSSSVLGTFDELVSRAPQAKSIFDENSSYDSENKGNASESKSSNYKPPIARRLAFAFLSIIVTISVTFCIVTWLSRVMGNGVLLELPFVGLAFCAD